MVFQKVEETITNQGILMCFSSSKLHENTYELIDVKNKELEIENLSKEEIDHMIEYLCTS